MEKTVILILCFGFSGILIVTSNEDVLSTECPKPNVRKRTIIRSAASIQNGAKLLQKLTVESARNCYSACCNTKDCNVAVMHYKQEYTDEGEEIMKKFCFLFDCGSSDSVCTYDDHSRYAVIEVPKNRNIGNVDIIPTTFSTTTTTTTTTTKIPTTLAPATEKVTKKMEEKSGISGEKCPPGAPVAMCADDPCKGKSCTLYVDAVCKPSYCGGCYAKFYDASGVQVKCEKEVKTNMVDGHNEEDVQVAQIDYAETPQESLPGRAHPTKKEKPTEGEDPYFNSDRRMWVDGKETGHLTNATGPGATDTSPVKINEKRVIVVNNSLMSVPLLIALLISIVLIIGLIYRFKCAPKGKPKKFPVDDGDYLINGMYL